jgi:hypothetical protein
MQSGRVEDFEFGLDLILDGLERLLETGTHLQRGAGPPSA